MASQLATLQLCAVTPLRSLAAVTAAGWCNRLLRLGVALPLFVVHDVGWLLAAPADALRRRVPQATTAEAQALCAGYSSLLDRLSSSPIVETTTSMRLRDELIAVLLTRIFGQLSAGYQRGATPLRLEPLPLEPGHYKPSPAPGELLDDALGFLRFLLEPDHCLHLLTAVEIIDVQMLRLLSTGQKARRETQAALENDRTLEAADGLDLIDLLQAVTAPEVRDVARFSMDLLPSVLETRRSAGSQHYPIGGYASLERRGSLDAVLWSELASDDEMFFLRLSENELLYHGRERRQDEGRGEHHILIDASASMHGLRQVFARGLAIALAQKLLLLGATVKLRFFDGRLHEPLQGDLSTALPYLLSFRSSRGRNYGRVFQDLLRELQGQGQGLGPASLGASLRGPKAARVQALHVITHGECHIATATVQALSGLAELHGVFMLPSSELALDYLPLLTSCAVITDEDLREPTARRQKALRIVDGIEKKPAR